MMRLFKVPNYVGVGVLGYIFSRIYMEPEIVHDEDYCPGNVNICFTKGPLRVDIGTFL